MSAEVAAPLGSAMSGYLAKANKSKVLMVGAGGIGCELLKNLVLSGFIDIVMIDLDTIDVTNLNRQFLFQREHVGKSKSQVAKESALRFNPDAKIKAIHDSIMQTEYGVTFFKSFDLVLNALDNRAARSHVNRMCLAADVPLVESGTSGYIGQVTVIRKGKTECYECTPKPHQKSFPGCTIRNTPSEPIHCIVWAKHLFNQLFGVVDADDDVSPDSADPELKEDKDNSKDDKDSSKEEGEAKNGEEQEKKEEEKKKKTTRQMAEEENYDPVKLFNKFFDDDIKVLLSMDKLWKKRTPPRAIRWNEFDDEMKAENVTTSELKDQHVWNMVECAKVFEEAVKQLKEDLSKTDHLVWDKDDEAAMNFVTACANVRMCVFHIPQKSRFDVKSMAGNIIPAIATTNAIIGGAIVIEAIKILVGKMDCCKTAYINRKPNPRGKILATTPLYAPNPKCYVCAEKPEVSVRANLEKLTVKTLEDKILKATLHMVAPDVEIDGKGVILISSEEGETECNNDKTLDKFGLADGSVLSCDDFLQNFALKVILYHSDSLADGVEFEIISDITSVQAQKEEPKSETNGDTAKANGAEQTNGKNGSEEKATNGAASTGQKRPADDKPETSGEKAAKDDSAEVVTLGDDSNEASSTTEAPAPKKAKVSTPVADDDIVCID